MTYMPKFIQSTSHIRHEEYLNLEAELLKKRSRESLSQWLGANVLAAPDSTYNARLESELQILEHNGFCGYFLIVADYVQWAKNNDIAVGPGRGSGPCSLVGFVLGITAIDPIAYDLPFERFVNPDRHTLPDFDLEFCAERRSEVSTYIQATYGADQVAQISSDDTTPLPSRLVICDRPLADLVPLYPNPESGFPTAKMNLTQIAGAGLIKFNVINQKAVTVIQRTVKAIATSGTTIKINHVDLDNQHAYRLLSKGEASNIAILDDQHYKSTLMAVQPDRFEQLCAVIVLCQPGAQGYIPLYVERIRNRELDPFIHPAIKSITAETNGLILYQEQVMHIAHKIAGFSYAQADTFRRVLNKSNREVIQTHKKKFIAGAMNFGLQASEATSLFEHVSSSNRRSYNKSHAVAFAMVAYQTAWLKANYPNEYNAVLSAK